MYWPEDPALPVRRPGGGGEGQARPELTVVTPSDWEAGTAEQSEDVGWRMRRRRRRHAGSSRSVIWGRGWGLPQRG